jgi:hypothetical protein
MESTASFVSYVFPIIFATPYVLILTCSDYQVLLHVFTDGEDNATSDEVERKNAEKESQVIRTSHKDLLHRFYYSFSDFEMVRQIVVCSFLDSCFFYYFFIAFART